MSLLWKMKPRRLQSETISSMEFGGIRGSGQKTTADYTRSDLRIDSRALQAGYSEVQGLTNVRCAVWSNSPSVIRTAIMRRREDREDRTYFRSERVFTMNGQWYFSAREGDCGPF